MFLQVFLIILLTGNVWSVEQCKNCLWCEQCDVNTDPPFVMGSKGGENKLKIVQSQKICDIYWIKLTQHIIIIICNQIYPSLGEPKMVPLIMAAIVSDNGSSKANKI